MNNNAPGLTAARSLSLLLERAPVSKKCRQKTTETVSAALALLVERFPATFVIHEARRKPLKVGIRNDLVAALNGAIMPAELNATLAAYTGNAGYLRALTRRNAVRVDLAGAIAGKVTEKQANVAVLMLADRRIQRERRQQQRERDEAEERERKFLP